MSYNNNWAKELRESYIEEKKAMNVLKKGAKVVAKGAKEAGKSVVKALGTRGGSSEAMHLGKGGMYDHVEHEGNNLQEEMALNEDLLMLIDILCEELGIDVEELLDLDEGSQGVARLARKAAGIAKRAARADANFGPSDSAGHEVRDELKNRATATNDQIDRKLSNSANRAKSRIVASGIGDKSTRSADAELKAKTGKTIGGHAQSNLDKLRATREVLQGKRGANFKPYSYDQQKEKVSLIRER